MITRTLGLITVAVIAFEAQVASALPLSSMECVADGLAYSMSVPNGGAPIASEQLVVGGQILISKGLDIKEPVGFATFQLQGHPTILKTEDNNDGTIQIVEQAVLVQGPPARLHPPLQFYKGNVVCRHFLSKQGPLP